MENPNGLGLIAFLPGDDLGSWLSIMVAKSPVSFLEVTFVYYKFITYTKILLSLNHVRKVP